MILLISFPLVLFSINQHAPKKPLPRKQKRLKSKQWITIGIHTSLRKRHSLFKSHILSGEDSEKSFYRKYSNKLTTPRSKKNSLHRFQKLRKPKFTDAFGENDDLNEIADNFNNFFCSIGKSPVKMSSFFKIS